MSGAAVQGEPSPALFSSPPSGVPHQPGTRLFASQALFSSTAIGVAVLDGAGRYVRANDVLARWHASTPAALVAGHLPHVGPDLCELAATVAATGQPQVDVEVRALGEEPIEDTAWLAGLYPMQDGAGIVVGALVVDVGAERRAETARAIVADRLALVARAGQLLATSLEPEETLANLGDLLVPALGDHAFIDMRRGEEFERVAIRHAAGLTPPVGSERPLGLLARYEPGHPVRRVAETGQSLFVADVLADPAATPPGPDTDFVRIMGVTSVMVLPVLASGRLLGTVALASSRSGRHYTADDVVLAQDVVDRAAVAIANSLRFAEQREVAVALQRSLLPQSLEAVECLDVAWRYVPGTVGTEVGGDWADVVELPGGRVAIVVGDVMGRGLQAAAVMGQLRTAVRALAVQDPPPSDLLARLDTIVAGLGREQIVTCVYAVYDPARATLQVANAGHLPPLVLLDGFASTVDDATAVPLGVGGVEFVQRTIDLPDGAVVALYTDGLVERRGGDLDEAVGTLGQVLADAPDSLEEACDLLLDRAPAAGGDGFTDDVALLLVRARSAPDADVVRRVFDTVPQSVSLARKACDRALTGWRVLDEDLRTTTSLLVSELVTNAVRYSAGFEFELLLRRGPRSLWVEVSDADTRTPRMRHAAPEDEGGRGLAMVAALASTWGSRNTLEGKVVWLRLEVGPGIQAS